MRNNFNHRSTRTAPGSHFDGGFGSSKRVDPYITREPFWNPMRVTCIALGAALLVPILAAPVMREPAEVPASEEARLVGLGCGPERLTFYAVEESDFPECEVIDTPEALCGADMNAPDCAAMLGDGW